MIAADTISFMRKLDVQEVHGYDASRGLQVLRLEDAEAGGAKA